MNVNAAPFFPKNYTDSSSNANFVTDERIESHITLENNQRHQNEIENKKEKGKGSHRGRRRNDQRNHPNRSRQMKKKTKDNENEISKDDTVSFREKNRDQTMKINNKRRQRNQNEKVETKSQKGGDKKRDSQEKGGKRRNQNKKREKKSKKLTSVTEREGADIPVEKFLTGENFPSLSTQVSLTDDNDINVATNNVVHENKLKWLDAASKPEQREKETIENPAKPKLLSYGNIMLTTLDKSLKPKQVLSEKNSFNDDENTIENESMIKSTDFSADSASTSATNDTLTLDQNISINETKLAKLRDRWWNIVKEKGIKTTKVGSSEKIEEEEELEVYEYVEIPKNTNRTNNSMQPCNKDPLYEYSNPTTMFPIATIERIEKNYLNVSKYPLHLAICNNDNEALKYLLKLKTINSDATLDSSTIIHNENQTKIIDFIRAASFSTSQKLSLIQLTTYLNRSIMLKLIIEENTLTYYDDNSSLDKLSRSPFMIASMLGYDSCLDVFLSYGVVRLNRKDYEGNTATHLCCRYSPTPSTIRLLLKKSFSSSSSSLQRILCARNNVGETPLHVACRYNRSDVVEEIISNAGRLIYGKILLLEDSSGKTPLIAAIDSDATEIVTLFLMWHCGNYLSKGDKYAFKGSKNKHILPKDESSSYKSKIETFTSKTCPLVAAANRGNEEMVRILLDFGTSFSSSAAIISYRLDEALCISVEAYDSAPQYSNIIQQLIGAGANPHIYCDTFDFSPRESYSFANSLVFSPLILSVCEGFNDLIIIMIETFEKASELAKYKRRANLLLRKQPESYFDELDLKEAKVVESSMRDALLVTLLQAVDNINNDVCPLKKLESSLILFKHGAVLDDSRLCRLVNNMSKKAGSLCTILHSYCRFSAKYCHLGEPGLTRKVKINKFERSTWSYWSVQLLRSRWMRETLLSSCDIYCPWVRQKLHSNVILNCEPDDEGAILIVEGIRIPVNRTILSAKSGKLDAAFRFAEINKKENTELTVETKLSMKMFLFLIQHCYHGSIVFGLSSNPNTCCYELLELSTIAEEFLCTSLLLECETRLLSARPYSCFCWCCCKSIEINNTSNSIPSYIPSKISSKVSSAVPINFSYNIQAYSSQIFVDVTPKINCLYQISSPSRLISPETCIDILKTSYSLIQGYRSGICSLSYDCSKDECSPLILLRIIALKTILQDFKEVFKSDTFRQNYHTYLDERIDLKPNEKNSITEDNFGFAVLQTCLEELISAEL